MFDVKNLCVAERLQAVEFSFSEPGFGVVLGANGAGKSTLLNALAGVRTLDSGSVLFNQVPIHEQTTEQRAACLTFLTQRQTLDFDFAVADVIRMGAYPLDLSEAEYQTRLDHLLERLDLERLMPRAYPTLSRGEAQRVQIARILMQRARQSGLVLLDEPLTALDLRQRSRVMDLLAEIVQEGHLILAVLHDLNLAARYADRCILMHQGAVVSVGATSDALNADLLSRIFDTEVHPSTPVSGRPQFFVQGAP